YAELWDQLGLTYTAHGALMIVGGTLFGYASLKARVLPMWTSVAFLAGLCVNLLLTFVAVDDLYQTVGTAFRNAGLVGMGWAILRPGALHSSGDSNGCGRRRSAPGLNEN